MAPTMMWSTTFTPISESTLMSRSVICLSVSLGRGSPEGWLW